jgi:hypothetical protein
MCRILRIPLLGPAGRAKKTDETGFWRIFGSGIFETPEGHDFCYQRNIAASFNLHLTT